MSLKWLHRLLDCLLEETSLPYSQQAHSRYNVQKFQRWLDGKLSSEVFIREFMAFMDMDSQDPIFYEHGPNIARVVGILHNAFQCHPNDPALKDMVAEL